MRRIARVIVLPVLMIGGLLALASPADAATIDVHPGQSIQAAINRANPGDTINVAAGTYRESLTIRKDGIKLIGAGDNQSGTVVEPPASANSFCGEGPHSFPGICVVGKKFDENFNVITPVKNVRVEGFLVHNFPGDGIITFGADTSTMFNDTAANNAGYGITSFVSTGNRFTKLVARNNGAPGFYIGDSANSSFILRDSVSTGNELGILIRNNNNGEILNNVFEDNCAGIFVLHHGGPPDQTFRVENWNIHDNQVLHNNKFCTDPEGGGIGGVGIALLGTKNVDVHDNAIRGNQRVEGSQAGGGVVVVNSKDQGGDVPVGNTVRNNVFSNNRPYDVFYDGTGSGNTFPGNDCNISRPAYICS
jgi:nitrous oxidase accessory protein NosD